MGSAAVLLSSAAVRRCLGWAALSKGFPMADVAIFRMRLPLGSRQGDKPFVVTEAAQAVGPLDSAAAAGSWSMAVGVAA